MRRSYIFIFLGIKPKPFTPIFIHLEYYTLFEIKVFFITTKDPIIQFDPISTLLSIIELLQ